MIFPSALPIQKLTGNMALNKCVMNVAPLAAAFSAISSFAAE